MIRYATIGSSWITEAFLQGAAAVPELQLAAVYSRREETGRALAQTYGAPVVLTDLNELARHPEVDAVYVASPNVCHAEQVRLLLENGKHVLCEKPLTADPRRTRALFELAEQNGRVLMEAIMMLHIRQLTVLEQAVARLGRISMAHFDFCQLSSKYPALLAGEHPNIFNPALETGTLMDLGVYCVYPALYLFGMPRAIHASATFLDTGADGAGSAIFEYDDKQVVLTYSKIGQSVAPSQIVGDGGCLTIGSISKLEQMTLTENGKAPVTIWGEEPKPVLMGQEAARFCAAICDPVREAARLEQQRRLAIQTAACMREIRRQAGIVFPQDEDAPPFGEALV